MFFQVFSFIFLRKATHLSTLVLRLVSLSLIMFLIGLFILMPATIFHVHVQTTFSVLIG